MTPPVTPRTPGGVEKLRALLEAASKRPWTGSPRRRKTKRGAEQFWKPSVGNEAGSAQVASCHADADAALIAAAVNALPALLEVAEAAEAERRQGEPGGHARDCRCRLCAALAALSTLGGGRG